MNFFIINLKEGASEQKLFISCLTNFLQNMPETSWNNTLKFCILWLTNHRMSLPTPRLPVREYSTIVTFKNMLDQ